MQLSQLFLSLLLAFPVSPVLGEPIPTRQSLDTRASGLLVDFNAERGDDPKKLGTLNLEKGKGNRPKKNTNDLYIKLDNDWKGKKCAHFHHKSGDRRAEYHALKGLTKSGTTYYITYNVALEQLPDGLILFQWKEYKANNDKDGGANIPLALELRKKKLEFSHTLKWKQGRKVQWTQDVQPHKEYKISLEILAKAKGGHVKLWFDGKPVTFDTTKSQTLTGNTFPAQSDPKFGIYGGQTQTVDSYVYQVQIGTNKNDVDQSYFGN
ncbi:hypothetical protein F4677DRAFT_295555 [Hypoxylon crocopeplum]|nr:hypothetical protein F4677DRAFT_295555 [Hypoxylon crocopeplum]